MIIEVPNNAHPAAAWKLNHACLPGWSKVARKFLLVQPSSAVVECVFSVFNIEFL